MSYATDQEKLGDAMTALQDLINQPELWDKDELEIIVRALQVIGDCYNDSDPEPNDYE